MRRPARWPPPPRHNDVAAASDQARVADPIIVLASGQRCGSTVVQRLISSHPDALVWGEHGGHLRELRALTAALTDWDRRLGPSAREAFARDAHNSFMANLVPGPAPISAAAREYILEIFAVPAAALGRPRWGFKEVRYAFEEVQWLRSLFPHLRVVHITRDPRAVLVSLDAWERSPTEWKRSQTRGAIDDWLRVNRSFLAVPEDSQHVRSHRYEDIIADPAGFVQALSHFLELDAGSIDRSVFKRHIHTEGRSGRRPRELRRFEELPSDMCALAEAPAVAKVAGAYGYSV